MRFLFKIADMRFRINFFKAVANTILNCLYIMEDKTIGAKRERKVIYEINVQVFYHPDLHINDCRIMERSGIFGRIHWR